MGFTYPDKFTYLNTFVIQVAQMSLDNGGPTVYGFAFKACKLKIQFCYHCIKDVNLCI